MIIKVLFFAQLKEIFGQASRFIEVPEGSRVRDVVEILFRESAKSEILRFAQDDGNFIPVIFAVNENFETVEKKLTDGDDLAIMTPVSGG